MTDKMIIKALELCMDEEDRCGECPYEGSPERCVKVHGKDLLDLINRQQQENRQLQLKLDDCERDIIPKLKYSLERANKYGAETDAENIRLLKENENLTSANENLTSDLTSAKAEIERLKGNASKIFISDKTPSRYFKVKSQQPVLIYPYQETKIELVPSTEQTKAEAIKEFAERLKERTISYVGVVEQQEVIDNLVKEMIGEKE